MMQAVGVALLAFGGAWAGFRAAGELSHRSAMLEELAASLAILEQELELGGYGLEECFRRLADRDRGAVGAFFADCAAGMAHLEDCPFPELWSRRVEQLPIGEEGQRVLASLGESLGRCEEERQIRALRSAGEALTLLARESREQYRRQGKVFQAVGVSAGPFWPFSCCKKRTRRYSRSCTALFLIESFGIVPVRSDD